MKERRLLLENDLDEFGSGKLLQLLPGPGCGSWCDDRCEGVLPRLPASINRMNRRLGANAGKVSSYPPRESCVYCQPAGVYGPFTLPRGRGIAPRKPSPAPLLAPLDTPEIPKTRRRYPKVLRRSQYACFGTSRAPVRTMRQERRPRAAACGPATPPHALRRALEVQGAAAGDRAGALTCLDCPSCSSSVAPSSASPLSLARVSCLWQG